MADNPYDPTQDYASAYGALQRRIQQSFAGQRANLNQELATRGVNTSGVSAIPSARLGAAQAGEEAGAAAHFAELQAGTKVADRQAAENYQRQVELAKLGYGQQDALSRRMANSGLTSALISGGLGALGSIAGGPVGGMAAGAVGQRIARNAVDSQNNGYQYRGNV